MGAGHSPTNCQAFPYEHLHGSWKNHIRNNLLSAGVRRVHGQPLSINCISRTLPPSFTLWSKWQNTCEFRRQYTRYLSAHSLAEKLTLLLSCITAQHTLHGDKALVTGDCGIDNVTSSPSVTGLLELTQHDYMLTTFDTFWACMSIMTSR
jgi:hypothetical protein